MKTAIQKVMDIIEMEHNNGVEISQSVLWKMLNKAKDEEKQQIIQTALDFTDGSANKEDAEAYYNETYSTNKETFK